MKWATEARLIFIVRIDVDILVLLKAAKVVVLLAGAYNALLNYI